MNTPIISLGEALDIIESKTSPRVTEDAIKGKISTIEFIAAGGAMTVCVITMTNGFKVLGHSAPASEANFDQAVGERISYDNAFRQLWMLEGYLLRDRLAQAVTASA